MPFITRGKTNLKYILIVVILAAIVSGGILGYYYLWIADLETRLTKLEIQLPEKVEDETPKQKYEIKYPNLENFEGKGDYYHWFLDEEPKVEVYSSSEFIECHEEEIGVPTLPLFVEKFTVSNILYSLCKFTDGAAGTEYTTYYALTTKDKEQFALSLTIGKVNCYAYGIPEYPEFQACEREYQKVEERVKELIVQILSTFWFLE